MLRPPTGSADRVRILGCISVAHSTGAAVGEWNFLDLLAAFPRPTTTGSQSDGASQTESESFRERDHADSAGYKAKLRPPTWLARGLVEPVLSVPCTYHFGGWFRRATRVSQSVHGSKLAKSSGFHAYPSRGRWPLRYGIGGLPISHVLCTQNGMT